MDESGNDKLATLIKRYQKEQYEFENHWMWQKLGTTPKQFFAKVHDYIEKSGVDKDEWQRELKEAKDDLETRMREQRGDYQKLDWKMVRGIRI